MDASKLSKLKRSVQRSAGLCAALKRRWLWVNVTRVAAAWTAEVTNPGGKVSGRARFSVVSR